jgi:hypothetical protein
LKTTKDNFYNIHNTKDKMERADVNNAITSAIEKSMGELEKGLALINKQAVNAMDPDRILGITRKKKTAERKRQAYLTPKDFDDARTAARELMYENVLKTYQTAYDQYIAAGFKHQKAVDKASAAAEALEASLQEAIDSEFEGGATALNQKQLAKKAELDLANETSNWD